jgi:phenylpropionate dioxygenase-like ring-hydroxylating dioxygenase large terminal subunit
VSEVRFPATQGVSVEEGLKAGWAIPSTYYTEESVLRDEQDRIFAESWQYAGPVDKLPEPGSFITTRVGSTPIVALRDKAGELRAFVNVCPHRSHEIADGEGKRGTLQCPYHAWTFDLDGSLRKAPRAENEPNFDPSEVKLMPAAVGQWGPMLFVNASASARPLDEALEDLPQRAEKMGLDLPDYSFHSSRDYVAACNWKVIMDNATECYHCAPIHHGFAELYATGSEDFKANMTVGELNFSYSIPLKDAEHRRGHDFQLYYFFPNHMVLVERDKYFYMMKFDPIDSTSTQVVEDFFFHASVPEETRDGQLEVMKVAIEEDRIANESVQRGLNSHRLPQARFLLEEEALLGHLQAAYYRALSAA